MSRITRAGLLRAALLSGLGALALPAAAGATLGGPAAAFTDRPALRSVTFSGHVASFNFDRPVRSGAAFGAAAFQVGGYRAGVVTPHGSSDVANVSLSSPSSVLVTYDSLFPDFDVATFGTVAAGAVLSRDGVPGANVADSAAIRNAGGQTGTRGHTAGPELVSVGLDPQNNRITYTFDQQVRGGTLPAASFRFATIAGDTRAAASVVDVSGPNVTVEFAAADRIDLARQAIVLGGIPSQDGATGSPPAASVGVPGQNPLTGGPSLTGVDPDPAGSADVFFTFDSRITGAVAAAGLHMVTSDGTVYTASAASQVATQRVRATFAPAIAGVSEHLVYASVDARAVTAEAGTAGLPSGRPYGGNAGALATGYTTAPDPLGATINRATGQVSVVFDSRLSGARGPDLAAFRLLKADGSVIGGAPVGSRLIQGPGPTQPRLVLQWSPAEAAGATTVQIAGNGARGGGYATDAAAVLGTIPVAADAQNLAVLVVPSAVTTSF